MSESFAELFEKSLEGKTLQPGSLIFAEVVEIKPDVVIVDAGLKSEGVIPVDEFHDENGELAITEGDSVEVALEAVEDGFGATRLSKEKAERIRTWDFLTTAYDDEESVAGKISGKVKGGYIVDVGSVRAFLPGSLVDIRPVRDTTYLEDKPLEFRVIKLDRARNNIVVSRRHVLEEEYSEERKKLLETLQEGVVLKGIVKNLVDYGAFVDLGGIDGLLHVTDMSWKRVKNPSDIVDVGQEIEVKVLKFDRERTRVSLGLKQLGDDPWINIARRYVDGSRLFGAVTNITDYGAFVEIEEGVEGLVHVSEMDWTNKNINPNNIISTGDEVEVMVLDIDEERRRISLGMKQCRSNPWEDFSQDHQKGDKVTGQIKSITDFGIFVGLPGNIDGLVHLSDLSWTQDGEEMIREYQKGSEVEAVVLSIDPHRERISLGIKQLEQDPIADYVASHPKGTIVNGTITEVDARGAVVSLGDDVNGYIRVADISRERIPDARTELSEGQAVEARFVGMDRRNHSISLSIKAKEEKEEKDAVREYSDSSSPSGTTSLGDLIKEQIGGDQD